MDLYLIHNIRQDTQHRQLYLYTLCCTKYTFIPLFPMFFRYLYIILKVTFYLGTRTVRNTVCLEDSLSLRMWLVLFTYTIVLSKF